MMPIRPSSSAEIRQLIDALGGTDDLRRETAVARLAVIGQRAVEHLLQDYPRSATARARVGMLRALEAAGDPRAVPLARTSLDDPSSSPEVVSATIAVLRAFLGVVQPSVARDALDALVKVALDQARPVEVRTAALDAMRDLPASVLEPMKERLAGDPNIVVRERLSSPPEQPGRPAVVWRDAIEGRLPPSPAMLKSAVAALAGTARLIELQHVVDAVRLHEAHETDASRRAEWRAVRGAVHQALAARGSTLALYDLRDSLLEPERLPVAFLAALEEIGDATCLEPLAAAYDASSRSGDAWWREHLAKAFRAIVHRDGLTRRHAAVKRALARWPEATADLMARS
jgi:hypothetical protein